MNDDLKIGDKAWVIRYFTFDSDPIVVPVDIVHLVKDESSPDNYVFYYVKPENPKISISKNGFVLGQDIFQTEELAWQEYNRICAMYF